ncbi:MAG: rRNA methyltransferase, partial [Spirochaetaceae bacterium]|nr:rRNA methyltransferase [Spirochaetaceae bacterium]
MSGKDAGIKTELEELMVLIEQTFPLEKRFRQDLPHDTARLSRLLTYEREEREDGYMGKAALLGAYLRYFLPWNVYRLSRILPGLPLALKDGDLLLDLGSGPLTFPAALWLCRKEFRSL